MEDVSVLVEYFDGHPPIKIVDFLIENKIFDYSKKQMMEEVGLSKVTFYKYFKKLEERKMVRISRTFGKTKLYQINEQNPAVKQLIEFDLVLSREAAREACSSELKHKQVAVARA